MDLKLLNGQFHRSTEPSPGVLLLEFNRLVDPELNDQRPSPQDVESRADTAVHLSTLSMNRQSSLGLEELTILTTLGCGGS